LEHPGIKYNSKWYAHINYPQKFLMLFGSLLTSLHPRPGNPYVEWEMLRGPMVWHLLKGFGRDMIKALVAEAVKKGVNIHYETKVKRILRETRGGPVARIIVEDKNESESRIEAKAAVIAPGGYANNKEWIKKYTSFNLGVDLFTVGRATRRAKGSKWRGQWEPQKKASACSFST
jgi:phytoene dehydrogenase-like protein